MLDILIKNGVIITQNESREVLDGNIGIKDGKIVSLGKGSAQAKENIDASNCVITPAYLNGHIHFGEYYLRGYKGRINTEEYIRLGEKFYQEFENQNEEIRISSIHNVLCESIQNGTLTVFGVRGWPHVQKFDINAYLGYPIMNSKKLSGYRTDFGRRFDRLKTEKNVEYFLGLHSLKWVTEEDLVMVAHFMSTHNEVKLSLHICETEEEVTYIRKKYNMSPVEVLEKYGLLNDRTLLVHCNYLSYKDINLIKEKKASVAVCHSSNLKLGNQPCDIAMLLKNGINVMIATDGPATSDSLSLLDAVRVTALISDIDSQMLYDMITINPAKYMEMNAGSIQVGKIADILFYDRNELNMTYKKSAIENLIYSSNCRPCKVMKEGNWIINQYKFVNHIDEDIMKEKNRIIDLIECKMGN